jgi:hypothetical protein
MLKCLAHPKAELPQKREVRGICGRFGLQSETSGTNGYKFQRNSFVRALADSTAIEIAMAHESVHVQAEQYRGKKFRRAVLP